MLTLAGWLSRHAWRALVSLIVIVLVLIAGSVAAPWAKAEWRRSHELAAQTATLAMARTRLAAVASPDPDDLARQGEARLLARRRQAEAARLSDGQLLRAAAGGDSDRIVAHGRAGAEIAALDAALLTLRAARAQGDAQAAERRARAALATVRHLRTEEARLNAVPLAAQRNEACRTLALTTGCERVARLDRVIAARATAERRFSDERASFQAARATAQRAARARSAVADARASLAAERERLAGREAALEAEVRDNWWEWVSRPVRDVLPQALLILLGVLLAPVAIKAVLYFVIAPAAGRRPPIRLLPGAAGVDGTGHVSAVTLSLPLHPGHELLVRPDFLQSSPDSATKRTRWLFDWSMPFTSLAAGLTGLTAVRGTDGRTVAVSAKDDPLAEVGRVDLPPGGAFVLQPRALIGLVQRADSPMRLTRHWRLGLTAWLTLQLRYLVIHGPGVAIVQGTRGVRLEEAGAGRVSDQAGTLGFDAALDYSVTRSETFGAFLMGKAELFDDRFRGDGRYLYEEMPRGRSGGTIWGRGLEGLGDAVLKVFGI